MIAPKVPEPPSRESYSTTPLATIAPQPFAHITLVEAAARSDCFTTLSRHAVEEPYPVVQRSHDTKSPVVQGADQALLESCGPKVIEWNGSKHKVFRRRHKIKDISPSSNSPPGVTVLRIAARQRNECK
jgi:hypothetical protein